MDAGFTIDAADRLDAWKQALEVVREAIAKDPEGAYGISELSDFLDNIEDPKENTTNDWHQLTVEERHTGNILADILY